MFCVYDYDAIGNVTEVTDRNGRTTEFDYNHLDLMVEERWLDGSQQTIRTIAFTYDLLGRMLSGSDASSSYAFTLDALGRVTEVDNQGTPGLPRVVLDQQFDAVGNRTALSAEVNSTADFANSYVYDLLSRWTSVTQTGQSGGNTVADKRVDFQYNALSQFASIERFADTGATQSVVASSFSYDHAGRLTDLTYQQGMTVLADYDWDFDVLGRVTDFWSLADGSVTYSYDDTDQLTGADYDYQTDELYAYDKTGNRTNTGYSTGSNNQLLSDGTFNFTYDDEGNRTSRTKIATGEVTEYSWDHRNRLVQVVEKDAQGQVTQTVDYTYDVFDRRIAKSVTPAVGPAHVEQFIYDGPHIALRFENGNLASRYLHGPAIDQILADEQMDLTTGTTDTVLWPLTDNLGTVRDLAEFDAPTGTTSVVNHIHYDAFGNITSESNATIDHLFAYTGRDGDSDVDLQYNRARWYDPVQGRWLSQDPIGFSAGDANLYRYVENGVTGAVDPSGLADFPAGTKYIRRDWWVKKSLVPGVPDELLVQDVYVGAGGIAAVGRSRIVRIVLLKPIVKDGGSQWFRLDGTALAKDPYSGKECKLPETNSLATKQLRERFGRLDDELIEAAKTIGNTYIAMAEFLIGPEDAAFWGTVKGFKYIKGALHDKSGRKLVGQAATRAWERVAELYKRWKTPRKVGAPTVKSSPFGRMARGLGCGVFCEFGTPMFQSFKRFRSSFHSSWFASSGPVSHALMYDRSKLCRQTIQRISGIVKCCQSKHGSSKANFVKRDVKTIRGLGHLDANGVVGQKRDQEFFGDHLGALATQHFNPKACLDIVQAKLEDTLILWLGCWAACASRQAGQAGPSENVALGCRPFEHQSHPSRELARQW